MLMAIGWETWVPMRCTSIWLEPLGANLALFPWILSSVLLLHPAYSPGPDTTRDCAEYGWRYRGLSPVFTVSWYHFNLPHNCLMTWELHFIKQLSEISLTRSHNLVLTLWPQSRKWSSYGRTGIASASSPADWCRMPLCTRLQYFYSVHVLK